jgi:integrase
LYANFDFMYAHHKLILDKRRPKRNGLFPVKLRVTYLREQKYYIVGVDLSEEDFERLNNNSVRKELRSSKEKIRKFESKVNNIIASMTDFSFAEFQSAMNKEVTKKINKQHAYQLFDKIVLNLRQEGRLSTAQAYLDARNSLHGYRRKLTFRQIDVEFLKAYETHMKSLGRSVSTIGIYLRHLRAVYNQAIEAGMVDAKYYPFGKSKYQIKSPRNIKKALTIDQISLIINYKVDAGSNQHFARDIWLFSYLCNGMNIKDIINLKFKNIKADTIEYDRAKTSRTIQNPKPIVIALLPLAMEIIETWGSQDRVSENYVFPILKDTMNEVQKHEAKYLFLKTINKYMKRIGEEIGYDKPLTTYAARHSFATVLKRSGTPMELISECLGHKSLQTTEAYLDSFEDKTRRKFMENLIPK